MPPQKLTLAVSQSRTLPTLRETLDSLHTTTKSAATRNVDLILFPEAYLGGYPRTCSFGAAVGARSEQGREQFLQYFQSAVDLGDTPSGAGEAWVEKKLPLARGQELRGDGTREFVERVARETGVFVVTGLVERAGGSLYCAVLYVCPRLGVLGKRRKVMPTGSERLVWAQGSPATLKAVTTTIRGVRLTIAAAICWENYMPLLRYSLYSQNVNLYLAPTADARDTWWPLMKTVGHESRAFVLSANMCVRRKNLPEWITGKKSGDASANNNEGTTVSSPVRGRRRSSVTVKEGQHDIVLPAVSEDENGTAAANGSSNAVSKSSPPLKPPQTSSTSYEANVDPADNDFVSRGGSCIVGPMGQALQGPLWEVEDGGLLITEADFEDCERGRLDLDVAGSYSRSDAFKLTVEGLNLNPPP